MSFGKAVKPEGYEEYIAALMIYKRACSLHRRTLDKLKGFNDPVSRLARADAKEVFSQVCKAYNAAQRTYAAQIARAKLKERGIDTSTVDFAKAAGVEFPLSMKDMLEQERLGSRPIGMSDEEEEAIKAAALAHMAKKSTRDQFLDSKDDFDSTL